MGQRIAHYPDGNIVQFVTLVYRVEPQDVAGLTVSRESQALRFFAKEELPPDDLIAVHRPIIERYLGGGSGPFLD